MAKFNVLVHFNNGYTVEVKEMESPQGAETVFQMSAELGIILLAPGARYMVCEQYVFRLDHISAMEVTGRVVEPLTRTVQ